MRKTLRKWLAAIYPVQAPGNRYGSSMSLELYSAGDYDYKSMAGDKYDNSVVLSCIRFLAGGCAQSRIVLEQLGRGSQWKEVEKHPILETLRRPNRFYSARAIWEATILSDSVDGNAYWVINRKNSGLPGEFYYLDHTRVRPISESAYDLIQAYEVQIPGGSWIVVPYEDVIHFRRGVDPKNPRRGMSRVGAVLREICTDNEASTYSASILRNMGVPGVIFVPKGDAVKDATPEQRQRLRDKWREFTADQRGEPMAASYPLEVIKPGFSPEDLVLDKVRNIPASRICSAFGIDPLVIHLPSDNKTYSNYSEAEAQAYNNALLPMLCEFADQLQMQLFPLYPDLDESRYRLRFDTSKIQALQDDLDALHERLRKDWEANTITRAEFRSATGWPVSSADNVYYSDTLLGSGASETDQTSVNQASASLAAWNAQVKAIEAHIGE